MLAPQAIRWKPLGVVNVPPRQVAPQGGANDSPDAATQAEQREGLGLVALVGDLPDKRFGDALKRRKQATQAVRTASGRLGRQSTHNVAV